SGGCPLCLKRRRQNAAQTSVHVTTITYRGPGSSTDGTLRFVSDTPCQEVAINRSPHESPTRLRERNMPTESVTKTSIDRSKTYVCRFSCGFETNWPAALGRHESARHNEHAPAHATVRSVSSSRNGKLAGKPRQLLAPAKMDRLLDELRKQHDEVLQALKKASLLVLAERDLRARESEQVKADLNAVYE